MEELNTVKEYVKKIKHYDKKKYIFMGQVK